MAIQQGFSRADVSGLATTAALAVVDANMVALLGPEGS